MGCGCSKRSQASAVRIARRTAAPSNETLGFVWVSPDGVRHPAEGQAPFFSQLEAEIERRSNGGGGTIYRVTEASTV